MMPHREEARDIYNEILSKIHQCPLQKVSKCFWAVSCLCDGKKLSWFVLFLIFFTVFDSEPSMPGPISVCSLPCGRTEELGRLQSITVVFPLGGTAYGHPGAESQTGLVLLHTLSRNFPAPTGIASFSFLSVPWELLLLTMPSSTLSSACLFLQLGMTLLFSLWHVENRLNLSCCYTHFDLWLSRIGIVWCSLQLPFCCRYSWVCWGSPPGAAPSSCRTRAAPFAVWSLIRMVAPLPRLLL